MAEGVGFEPTGRVNAQRFSRPPLSAAQPSLRFVIISRLPSARNRRKDSSAAMVTTE